MLRILENKTKKIINGANICLDNCNNSSNYKYELNGYCYEKCANNYFYDRGNYHCTVSPSCPNEYPVLIEEKKECIKSNFSEMIQDLLKIDENFTKEEEIQFYDSILNITENYFISKNYDTYKLDMGIDEIYTIQKLTVTFTTTQNQRNNANNNISTIDLGECETLLRNSYNISKNETLYIKKIDVKQERMKIPKIEYDIYFKLPGKNLEKLNTSICHDTKISISLPIEINENIDEFNTASGYYNDICYTATSDSGTDILLKDRQKEFIDFNKTICQDDCDFSDYNYTIKKVNCTCQFKESSSSFEFININVTNLLKNFRNIKSFTNINFIICYENLKSPKNIFSNVGSYIQILFLIFHIISIFIFYLKQLNLISSQINDIIYAIEHFNLIKDENKKGKRKKSKDKKNVQKNVNKNACIINHQIKHKKRKKKRRKNILSEQDKDSNINIMSNNEENNDNKITLNIISEDVAKDGKKSSQSKEKYSEIEKVKNIMKYTDDEINTLSYELAIQNDKRTFSEYYISLLKTKHNLIYSFFYNNDYNSKIIKMDIFFFGFSIHYIVNALFFNDDTMHKLYLNKGSFKLENQLPIIISSSFISLILNSLIKLLALSNDSIINLKQKSEKENVKERGIILEYKLKIKFILFFAIGSIFLMFFWYYITIFGIIYKNTQYNLLKDTLISFFLSLIYPFGIYLLPGLFRIPSLADDKKNRKFLYNFSKVLQII